MSDATDCDCCGGIGIDTPVTKFNRSGQRAVAYRVGTHADFKATILARLSGTDYPALASLTTRSDDDYTIALCDGFAVMADVLTFYQERIANEAYLRTATERRSVLELTRLIGYQLAPGLAASTNLAFLLQDAPGQPAQAAQPVTIPAGTRVQSVPDPSQDPQNFETVADISARVEWNAIPAQQSERVTIASGLTELYLAGTNTQLQPGDAILIVGTENDQAVVNDRWDVLFVDRVDADLARNLTRVAWADALSDKWSAPSTHGIRVRALRQRAALFGNNAPDANLILNDKNQGLFNGAVPYAQWKGFRMDAFNSRVDLDAVYPKIVTGSWVVLTGEVLFFYSQATTAFDASFGADTLTRKSSRPLAIHSLAARADLSVGRDASAASVNLLPPGDEASRITSRPLVELYRVRSVTQLSRKDFGVSGKLTRLVVDRSDKLADFDLRDTFVLGQSEELALAARPLIYPVFGSTVVLDRLEPELAPGQLLAISGKRQRVAIAADPAGTLITLWGGGTRPARPGESFVMRSAPETLPSGTAVNPEDLDPSRALSGMLRWHLEDHDGQPVQVDAPAGVVQLQPAAKEDEMVSEGSAIAAGAEAISTTVDRTTIRLLAPLASCYERATFVINANVAPATHGETVSEIAGSGDAGRANQSFISRQSPLTYVSATSDPTGRASTLEVRVNDLLWREVPTLYGRTPRERVYAPHQDNDSKTTIAFGDGVSGARLPSGQNNVRLTYRKGLGAGGNLRAGQLTTLLTRPLGVKSVVNPAPSVGGQDAETLSDARTNGPLRVLTLDRAVSVQDYADFARTFAGIAKAHAMWIDDGRASGMYITVAGPDGAAIPTGTDPLKSLTGALRRYGDPLLPLLAQSYAAVTFRLKATVMVASDAETAKVLAAVESALRASYAFAARDFGQSVTIDEVYATIHNVPSVVAADIQLLYRVDQGAAAPQPSPRLLAALPSVAADGSVGAAELLTLDPGPLDLGVMA
jgi:hypothetical protein